MQKFIVFVQYCVNKDYVEQFLFCCPLAKNTSGKLSLLVQTLDNCKQIKVDILKLNCCDTEKRTVKPERKCLRK